MKTPYQFSKESLTQIAIWAKKRFPDDKPKIREIINNSAHSLCSEYSLSEKKQMLLHDYACKLHP